MRIKNCSLSIGLSGLLFCSVFSSCVKSNSFSGNTTYYPIFKLVNTATNLTLLDTALIRTGLDSMFNQPGAYTFFVATDASWQSAGLSDSLVNTFSDSLIKNIILYSTWNKATASAQFPAGPNAPIHTLSGDSIFITNSSSGIFVNGISLLAPDLMASNGLIDALNQPLLPPAGTLLQLVQADTLFSFFTAAVARTSAGETDLNPLLSSGAIYTIFLPTNDAFRAAGFLTMDSITNANPDSLSNLLAYHIVPKRLFTSDFSVGTTQNTLLGINSTIQLSVLGGVIFSVQGTGNLSPIPLGQANIMAHNGVLHIIGQLLLQ
jgi:uncharacterized surface protein with fasciclin (FAS1) repeats